MVICEPPGDSGGSMGYLGLGCLVVESFPPGDSCYNSGTLKRLAVRVVPPGGIDSVGISEALGAWRYVSPARRSGSGTAWRHVSPARRFYYCSLELLDSAGVIYKDFGDASKVGLLVFLELSSKRIPWVELGIRVKHVAFLELSLEWHPSSWARDGGWTRGTLELSSGWRVLLVWVCWLWPVWMGPDRLPSSIVDWRVW